MVKVKDDPIMAEPTQALPSYPSSSKRKSRPYPHHSHLPPQYSTHYHYCTYLPDGNEEIDLTDGATSPAKFYFGPGFEPQQPCGGGPRPSHNQGSQFVVFFHVNPGVTISFQMGDNLEILRGPVTVPMVSTNSSPPIAMPVQVPPGHMVQQIVDENGTLRHVILSPQHPPDIVSFTSHNSQTYGTCPGNSTNPSQHFFPGVSTTAYPTHFHSNMQPSHPMIPSPTHMRHSPPSNSTYYKDERTQRQHIKLKKKLNEKQRSDAVLTRRECANDLSKDQKESELNSVGTSENGEGSSVPEEDSYQLITDILSSVQPPVVSELTSRSALLQWAPPVRLLETLNNESQIEICESDLRYEVLLSDKSKEMKFKSIYSGTSLSCRIQDLKPGQDYSVCLQVHLDEFQGFATDPLKFSTPCCEPDQPQPPKLIHRSKNSLQLKWNSVNDNGSHVLYYVLEFDDGKCGDFIEFYRGRGKTHTLQKLQPATSYTFRLAVVNDVGKSLYSHSISYSTFDNPPTQPVPPTLIEADVHTLQLKWPRRPKDDEFILQMNDIETKYGFLNVYHGKDNYYVCRELNRFTDYVFRLRTKNEDGASPWSDEITYRTLPDRPTRPSKPVVKGRIHAHFFKIKWEPPNDTGGVPITEYILEVNSGSGYETVYAGPETDAVCDKLTPGTTYQLRVSCVTQGGCSNYSDPCTVTTDAISPGLCSTPRVQGKVKANSAVIRWMKPDYNGGAPVLDYELEVVCTSSNQSVFYKSKETEFTINNLNPGSNYVVAVRAVNRIGPGNWSEPLKVTSGAAPPSPPCIPTIVCRTPNHVYVEWSEPICNGAPVVEYRLEMSPDKEIKFASVFQGLQLGYDVRSLAPAQTYYFRVQAFNSAGSSLFSPIASITTPAAPPSLVTTLKGESTTRSIKLYWNPPIDNGSDITHYNIEIGDKTISTVEPVTEYLLENLQPNTLYKIKIQAVNGVAPGSFSSSLRISTSKLPPSAPALECVGVGHNYLKLRWGEGRNLEYIQYCVEIENILTREFSCVYKGTALTCKVNKLQEITTYKFRINATNDTGVGDFSSIFEFTTGVTPPGIVKNAKVMDVEHSSCTVEWAPAKNAFGDPVVYEVQLAKTKQLVFKQVHKSSETKCRIDSLEPSVEYSTRIVPYRITSTGELPGPSSAQINFTTLAVESEMTSKPTTSNYLQRNHSFHHSIWQLSLLKNLTGKYSSHIYVIAIMILGVIISLGIASFL